MENLQEMNASRAISVLIQGVEIAQKQGAYTLDDAELLSKAVKFFRTAAKTAQAPEEQNLNVEPQTEAPQPEKSRSKK